MGGGFLIQVAPQVRILVAVEAVDGRKGIDAIAQLCREKLNADPYGAWIFKMKTAASLDGLLDAKAYEANVADPH